MIREPHLAGSSIRLLIRVHARIPAGVRHGGHHQNEERVSCAGCEGGMHYTIRVCALYILVYVNTVFHNLRWTCNSLLQGLPNTHPILLLYPELPQRSTICAHVELGAALPVSVEVPVG